MATLQDHPGWIIAGKKGWGDRRTGKPNYALHPKGEMETLKSTGFFRFLEKFLIVKQGIVEINLGCCYIFKAKVRTTG